MDRQFPELQGHNIFLVRYPPNRFLALVQPLTEGIRQAEEYKESFDDIFRRSSMPREPSFYVNVPSRMYAFPSPSLPPVLLRNAR